MQDGAEGFAPFGEFVDDARRDLRVDGPDQDAVVFEGTQPGSIAAAGVAGSYANPAPAPDLALVRRGTTTLKDWAATQNWPS